MSNLIFDVSKNWKRYDSSTDYGESIMKEFCSLIGATYINNRHGCCYGFGDAKIGEYTLSLTVQRERPRLDVRIDGIWDADFKIKDLTRKRLDNLIAKIYDYIAKDEIKNKQLDKKKAISEALWLKSIHLKHDNYFAINGFEFRLEKDGTVCCCSYIRKPYFSLSYEQTEEELSKSLNDFMNEFKEKKSGMESCKKIAVGSIEQIKEYFAL